MKHSTGSDPAYIDVQGISKSFRSNGPNGGATLGVLNDINFVVDKGSFLSIVGPSGCGKSTLLQIIAGLVLPTRGRVLLNKSVVDRPPHEMIYVFQQYAKSIYPWKTVMQNVVFGISHRQKVKASQLHQKGLENIELMGLKGFENYYPWQLSGGMQQRVALARGLICQPDILLMDEPFSSIDALTRAELQDLVLKLWSDFNLTILFVTHDIEEALYVSDRVLVLGTAPARILQDIKVDLPHPRNQLSTKEMPGYLRYRHQVLEQLSALR